MEPIMRNGHVVQGVGFEFLPQAPPPVNTDPHQKGPGGGGGGNSGTTPGTYSVTVTGTAGSTAMTTTVSVTVN